VKQSGDALLWKCIWKSGRLFARSAILSGEGVQVLAISRGTPVQATSSAAGAAKALLDKMANV
jgi:hypothetical protein